MKATNYRKIKQMETQNTNVTYYKRIVMWANYAKSKQNQKLQNVPFQKNRFFNILCRIRYQTQLQTGLTTPYHERTKNVP